MKSYFAYVRVSDPKQGRGASLPEQRDAIEKYATRHGLRIAGWYEETETAAKLGRGIFNRMLKELEAGTAAGVVIHKVDRSARHLKDWAHLGELMDRGIEVHFAHENLDLNSRSGRLTADILAVMAADYIRNLRDEVLKGFYGRLKQGFYPLPAPLGYVDRGAARAKELDTVRAPLVRQMFELYASGRYSIDTLRMEMIRRGLRSRRGGTPSRPAFAAMLHNPFYIGLIHIKRRGETFQGVHEPLVTKTIFDRVQAVASGRLHARVVKHDFLFRRLIRCALCGHLLTGERQKGLVYYRCHTPGCRTSVREDYAESCVRTVLGLLALSEEEMRDVRDLGDEGKTVRVAARQTERARLKRALALCEDRIAGLADALVDQTIDKETYQLRNVRLLAERRELQDALSDPKTGNDGSDLLSDFELGNTAYLRFNSPIQAEKREVLESMTSNLVAEGKELGITPRFPFFEIINARLVSYCGPGCDDLRKDSTDLPVDRPQGPPSGRVPRNGSTPCPAGEGDGVPRKPFSKPEISRLWEELVALRTAP